MVNELDHLVLATPDLPATVAMVTRALGVSPVEGGRHVGRGTRNFLLGLGAGGYLEIIGVDADQPAPRAPRPFLVDYVTEPRLVTWAVRVSDIDATVAEARTVGYDPGSIADMSRQAPDGQTLSWRLTGSRDVVPFLIDWGSTAHPSESLPQVRLRTLDAVHPDPVATIARLRALWVELGVRPGIRPGLIAVLDGPHGSLTLL